MSIPVPVPGWFLTLPRVRLGVPPHPAITAELLADLIRQVAAAWFVTVSHPIKPKEWGITWGAQVDPRVVRLTGGGQISDVVVASYLAKYATKSTEPVASRLGGSLRRTLTGMPTLAHIRDG